MRKGLLSLILVLALPAIADDDTGLPPVVGRWDITVHAPGGDYPMWMEIVKSGNATLVGYFVGRGGSMRPVSKVDFSGSTVSWSLPVQWEKAGRDLHFTARYQSDKLSGQYTDSEGRTAPWTAVRAPKLTRIRKPVWGRPIELFNGHDLTGWHPHFANRPNGWVVRNGIMINQKPGNDIVTDQKFTDFKVHAEFRYPKDSNSGIYLRGRYEAQIEDNWGKEPDSHGIGGIYGFLKPLTNPCRKPGEWQTYDVELVGRVVTVKLNGVTVIERQEIPGITGGALDSNEGEPGPLYIQGDHGPVEFRKVTITPAQ